MEKVRENFKRADIVIGAAAVGDFTAPKTKGKIKREGSNGITLHLEPTEDIMAWAGRNKGKKILVGYSAQSGTGLDEAKRKIKSKNLDMIVYNDIGKEGLGFESDNNDIKVLGRTGAVLYEGKDSKENLAAVIMGLIEKRVVNEK